MQVFLLNCGLVQFRKNTGYSVLEQEWSNFKMEYQLMELEVTHFTTRDKKKRYYVRLGSWNVISHKRLTPGEIWLQDDFPTPRIRTSSLSRTLAKAVGSLDLALPFTKSSFTSCDDEDESSTSTDNDEEDNGTSSSSLELEAVVEPPLNLPDPNKFPLLHSLFLSNPGCNLFDRLLNEITRLNESTELKFKRGNNTEGTMIIVPAFRGLDNYEKHLKGNESVIDSLLNAITRHSKCQNEEAAEALLMALYHKCEEPFISVAVRKGVANGIPPKVMDEVSVETMLHEAGVNWTNGRILFRHLRQFFGRSLVVSERKRRSYFGNNDFPPEVDRIVLPDKTVVSYWWKQPDLLLKHQMTDMVTLVDLDQLSHVDICVGGDHGAGRFRMLLKLLLRFHPGKETIIRRFEVANVSHSKDDIDILNTTVLQRVVMGLENIHNGGRFIVSSSEEADKLELSFDEEPVNRQVYFNVPISIFINGDLKFFAQMLGRDGMSTSWCMYCKIHPKDWSGLVAVPEDEMWTVAQQIEFVDSINAGRLKEAKDKKGIVTLPLLSFVEPKHFIFPQLHFEIGTVNNVLDALRGFIEDEVEALPEKEVEARNAKIIADASYTKAKELSNHFNTTGQGIDLKLFRIERARINQALKNRNLPVAEIEAMQAQKQELDEEIEWLSQEEKRLKTDASAKRKTFLDASKALKHEQEKKNKIDSPVTATMESILSNYDISPARYHGGKLNGVDCREFMSKAQEIFPEIEVMLLSAEHPLRCSDDIIIQRCNLYRDALITLDIISSKVRIKQGALKDEDLHILRRSIDSLNYLWSSAGLSFTPKIHGMLAHVVDQVESLNGIGDMLEDDLEHLHQVSKRIMDRTSKIKDVTKQAFAHSKIEAKHNNKEIIAKTRASQLSSKRQFKKPRIDAAERAAQAKNERDTKRFETLAEVEQQPYTRLVSFYESEKTKLMEEDNIE